MALDRERIQAANDATYAADAVLIDAGSPEPGRGREAIRARAVGLLGQLS